MLEFAADQALGTRYQPGVDDTMTDLLLGNLGAAYLLLTSPRGQCSCPDQRLGLCVDRGEELKLGALFLRELEARGVERGCR